MNHLLVGTQLCALAHEGGREIHFGICLCRPFDGGVKQVMSAISFGVLLTTGWADLFGSPKLTGQYLAAGGASSWRRAEFDILFQERFLKGARAPLSG